MNRHFKGVWMPKEIYLHPDLSWTEKILLIEIQSLQGEEGCFASNQYLAEFLGTSEKTVMNTISKLKGMGYIKVEQLRHPRRLSVNPKLFISTSQNREVEESTSQNREVTSQKREVTSQNRDVAIYRINNTENKTVVDAAAADSALDLYRKYYPKVPLHIFNQEMLMALENNLDVFNDVLEIWVGRQYREQNIKGMMSLYERLLTDKSSKEQKLFCDKCESNSGWLPVGEGWERCKH